MMNTILAEGSIEITDCMGDTFHRDISSDIFRGLTSPSKFIPSKYFYDEEGSRLFEHICHLPEYYQTSDGTLHPKEQCIKYHAGI